MIVLILVGLYFSALFDPTLAIFTARMKLTRSRCAHGVLRRKRKEATTVTCAAAVPRQLHANIAAAEGVRWFLPRSLRGGARGWEHEPGMCINSNVHRRCIKMAPGRRARLANGTPIYTTRFKWLQVANLGQTSGVRQPHMRTTLVAWDEPWPHLNRPGASIYFSAFHTVGK